MKKYRIEIINKRDGCVVYKHSTNNFETLKKCFSKYCKECETYPFYNYETYSKIYIDNKLNNDNMLFAN